MSNKSTQPVNSDSYVYQNLRLIENNENLYRLLLRIHCQDFDISKMKTNELETLYFITRREEDKKMELALTSGEITQEEYNDWETERVEDDVSFDKLLSE
jgi:hypothetical protein